MGWFSDQIRQRAESDERAFHASMSRIAEALTGDNAGLGAAYNSQVSGAKSAIDAILTYYRAETRELPDNIEDLNAQLSYLLRPSGIMWREVRLSPGWRGKAIGAMLGTLKASGAHVALIPRSISGYDLFDPSTGQRTKLTRKNESLLADDVICFYKPFPQKEMSARDLLRHMLGTLDRSDYLVTLLATVAAAALGLLPAWVNQMVFRDVVGVDAGPLPALLVMYIGVTVSMTLIAVAKKLVLARVNAKIAFSMESASMMRVLSLPVSFFRGYNSGDISTRLAHLQALGRTFCQVALDTGLTGVFALVYIGQIWAIAPSLCLPALAVLVCSSAFSVVSALAIRRLTRQKMGAEAAITGLQFALLGGVQKLRLAGAERRAFSKFADKYADYVRLEYNPPLFMKISGVLTMAIHLMGSMLIYYSAVRGGVGVAQYMAFGVAYGMVAGAFATVTSLADVLAQVQPMLAMAAPILTALPEQDEERATVRSLSGVIELDNVSFRYDEGGPLVLTEFSLKIRAGQYVAIVGRTGCGKSTLVRLLLGFERPESGSIFYDGRDLQTVDLKSLRGHIGTVLQDSSLFTGSLYNNIAAAAPGLSMDGAWAAAELAGLADEIRAMPMGMHTMISEGTGGVSGGQKQRLMIARAVAGKPKVLIFDEATSALDNVTQKRVSEALEGLRCTRVVIAHRLSTIRACDRVVLVEGGRIVEDGSYDELVDAGGRFADLVRRQQLTP